MRFIRFLGYYVNLHAGVMLGLHQTMHPLGISRRWRWWSQRDAAHRGRPGRI